MVNIVNTKKAILIKQKSFGVFTQLKLLLQKIFKVGYRTQIKHFSYAPTIHEMSLSNARGTVQYIDLKNKGGNRWE
jgi:hypothetical protein